GRARQALRARAGGSPAGGASETGSRPLRRSSQAATAEPRDPRARGPPSPRARAPRRGSPGRTARRGRRSPAGPPRAPGRALARAIAGSASARRRRSGGARSAARRASDSRDARRSARPPAPTSGAHANSARPEVQLPQPGAMRQRMRALRETLGLVAVCAALYLAGTGTTPFYTRGEPREGLVVREMLATGRWLVPERPAGEVARKPPLYYWLAAICLRALPARPERALRLPSALGGTAGVLVTWVATRRAFGAPAGLPAALALATAFEWARAATSARVDRPLAAALAV